MTKSRSRQFENAPPLDKWASYDESMIFFALDLSELDLGVPDLVKEQIRDEMSGTFMFSPS